MKSMLHGPLRPLALVLPLALAACSVASPPTARTPMPPHRLTIIAYIVSGLPEGSKPPQLQPNFIHALSTTLAMHGVSVRPGGGDYGLTVATAVSSAEIGITQSDGKTGQPIVWSAPPRKHGMFDGCRPQRLRVVVSDQWGDRQPHKIAEGEITACKFSEREYMSLASRLADELTPELDHQVRAR